MGTTLLTCGNDLLTCGNDLLTCGNDFLSCGNDLLTCGNNLLTCGNDFLCCGNDLLSCGNEIKKMQGKQSMSLPGLRTAPCVCRLSFCTSSNATISTKYYFNETYVWDKMFCYNYYQLPFK